MTTSAKTAKPKTSTTARKKTTTSQTARKKSPKAEAEVAAFDSAEPPTPSQEEIALVAYFIYQHRMAEGIPGDEISDWHAAEEEIMSEVNVPALA